MADMVKKYYYAPTWNHVPGDPQGIALGNVIISPKEVWPPLLAASTSPEISGRVVRQNVHWTKEQERSGAFSIYTRFLETLGGAGVDVSTHLSRKRTRDFDFEEMTTEEFIPPRAYVKDRIRRPDVVEYLEGRLLSSRVVYMIIGVKYVSGVVAKQTEQSTTTVEFGLGADATLISGTPLSSGIEFSPSHRQANALSWTDRGTFVFAFRVARITMKRKGDDFGYRPYERGAMYGSGTLVKQPPEEPTFEVDMINDGGIEVVDNEEKIVVSRAVDFKADV